MKAEDTVRSFQRHLRALLRAELLIAEIKLNALLKKTMLMAVAGVIAVFGLATLNVAAYHLLVPIWGDLWALVAVAAGDFVITGALMLAAARPSKAPTLPLATELRDQAIAALDDCLGIDTIRDLRSHLPERCIVIHSHPRQLAERRPQTVVEPPAPF